jgi:hypothetical protein
MQQSSKAQDRTLGVWFHAIQHGAVKLPRFQRFESWDRSRIQSFLQTIISNLPVGVTLALEVSGVEKFESRYIATSVPATPATVTQHLLDGQQRLTAFWRAMHNNYERETFFIYIPRFNSLEQDFDVENEVRCVPRWENKQRLRMPRWADDPAKCLERGLVPVSLLRPGDILVEIESWLNRATAPLEPLDSDPDALAKYKAYTATRERIKAEVTMLRERVTHFNLPYLSLPADTAKDVALQVFINMNTNSKPLSQYDIIVAEVESVTGTSLHKMVADLDEKHPRVRRYGDLSDLVLATSALLQDQTPNIRGMIEMDKKMFLSSWPEMSRGLERMAAFLDGQKIFDAMRLPTNAVLPVIAAAYALIPEHGDFLGKAEKLLRRYLWSSFFTDRYENTAGTRAFADFKALKALLLRPDFSESELTSVSVLNRNESPLADVDSLMTAGWPKAAGIEARAILAISTYFGAIDFADAKPATFESVQGREYHHIFPDALLKEAGIVNRSLAVNCALITWKTNRIIGRKDPLDYLEERTVWTEENEVRNRLKSHLISYDSLRSASYTNISGPELAERLSADFNEFLFERARLIETALIALADGETLTLDGLHRLHKERFGNHLDVIA